MRDLFLLFWVFSCTQVTHIQNQISGMTTQHVPLRRISSKVPFWKWIEYKCSSQGLTGVDSHLKLSRLRRWRKAERSADVCAQINVGGMWRRYIISVLNVCAGSRMPYFLLVPLITLQYDFPLSDLRSSYPKNVRMIDSTQRLDNHNPHNNLSILQIIKKSTKPLTLCVYYWNVV